VTSSIFHEKDQTRKIALADTTSDRQGGRITEGKAPMKASHLRVYYGPQEESANVGVAEPKGETVTVPLMEIMPLLADAVQSQRTWLRDFADDEVTISMDLYEVILAYQHYRRPSA
jgi:hypothetical protein